MDQSKPFLRAVFTEAAEIIDPAARAAFLDSACKDNPALRERVERLLKADSQAGNFLGDRAGAESDLVREAIGARIGRYRLVERIGRGGFGTVYLAEQEEPLRRHVALKVLKLGMDTQSFVARFESERQALALMEHPNIAKVLDAGATDAGRPFLVMELVRGVPITNYCDQNGLSVRQRLELFILICHAVQHAHQKGIVHRDLKPSNILVLDQDGVAVPKVIDFGIAKAMNRESDNQAGLTSENQFIGTPAYMSPEQVGFGGHDVDTRSDIYSLGVILYELLTGRPPFHPNNLLQAGLEEMRRIIREVDPPRPSTTLAKNVDPSRLPSAKGLVRERLTAVRGDMDWIVMKCLEKDRARRYETANGLAMDIRRHLEDEPVVARPPSQVYRFQKTVRRHRLGFTAAGIIALVLVAAVIVSTQLALRAARAEREEGRLRGVAESKAEESRQRLLQMQVGEGNRLVRQGDPISALTWYVAALQSAGKETRQEMDQRLRIAETTRLSPRLLQTVFHGPFSVAMAFSLDGSRLATGGKDYAVRVWNIKSGKSLLRLPMGNLPRAAQFSPDGKRLAAIDREGIAYLWDAQTGKSFSLQMPSSNGGRIDDQPGVSAKLIPTIAFSPDGQLLLIAWRTNFAQLVRAKDGRPEKNLIHEARVYHATFSANGQLVSTASTDQSVRIWNVSSGKALGSALQHKGFVGCSQFSPDGTRLLTVLDHKTVVVWDWQSGSRIGPDLRHDSIIVHASFSRDGKTILTASTDSKARLWDATAGQLISHFSNPASVTRAAFSPDGTHFATVCEDSAVRLWEIENDRSLVVPHGTEVEEIAFSANGRLAAAGTLGVVRIWDLNPREAPLRSWPGHNVLWAEMSADGTKVVTASRDGAQIWSATNSEVFGLKLSENTPVQRARFSGDGKLVLTLSRQKTAFVWDASSGVQVLPGLTNLTAWADGAFSPDNRHVALVGKDPIAGIWDISNGAYHPVSTHTRAGTSVAFSPDGKLVAVGAPDHTVQVCDAETGKPILPTIKQPNFVRQLRFSPDGQRLATACSKTGIATGYATILSVATGEQLGAQMGHLDDVLTVEFSHDGRRIITGCDDRAARIWDAFTGEPTAPPLWHAAKVIHAVFAPGDGYVATLTARGDVQLWSATTGEAISQPISHEYAGESGRLSFSPNGHQLVIATGGEGAWLREFAPDLSSISELSLRVQVLSGRRLDPAVGLIPIEPARLREVLRAWGAEQADGEKQE